MCLVFTNFLPHKKKIYSNIKTLCRMKMYPRRWVYMLFIWYSDNTCGHSYNQSQYHTFYKTLPRLKYVILLHTLHFILNVITYCTFYGTLTGLKHIIVWHIHTYIKYNIWHISLDTLILLQDLKCKWNHCSYRVSL